MKQRAQREVSITIGSHGLRLGAQPSERCAAVHPTDSNTRPELVIN